MRFLLFILTLFIVTACSDKSASIQPNIPPKNLQQNFLENSVFCKLKSQNISILKEDINGFERFLSGDLGSPFRVHYIKQAGVSYSLSVGFFSYSENKQGVDNGWIDIYRKQIGSHEYIFRIPECKESKNAWIAIDWRGKFVSSDYKSKR